MAGMLAQAADKARRFDFEKWFDDHGVTLIATIVVAILVTVVVQVFVRRFRRRLEGSPSVTQELNIQRIARPTGARATASAVGGKVEALSLRVTSLRAFDGTLHIVPNGNIQLVSNKSRGWARAIVDVRVAYGEDVDRVRGILEGLFEGLRLDEPLRDWVRAAPRG